jgi:maltose alpha-D-glucosyltransferase/alpha-amylase
MLNLWYKNAIIYCVDVETFMDSNGDGVGDFAGLKDRLDHIEGLGATTVWLLPFFPSPNRDNGYDITDFYGVDPRLGTLGDFVDFTEAAHDHGLRVIVDLVINHTSVDHPWFQTARRHPDSPYRDWYVWSKEKPKDAHQGVAFPGVQESIWSYDDMAGQWYLHRFYPHQADLNTANPAVREEIEKIMGFWLQLGVSGFRVDALPFALEYKGIPAPKGREDPLLFLEEMREFLSWRRAEAILLGEANIPIEEVRKYFGDGSRLHMMFNFLLNQEVFLALARGDGSPIRAMLKRLPEIDATSQWVSFLRNHDEVDLGRLSEKERGEVFAAFGPEEHMQLYGRGIRRRFASMLGGDLRRLRMAYNLMLSLPGTPMIWSGDEIGMGDDLSLEERNAVRTPIQWDAGSNAGFSSAVPRKLVRPVVTGDAFGHERVNVAEQQRRPDSLLNFFRELIRVRRAAPELGWGGREVLEVGAREVIALLAEWEGQAVLTLHNLSDRAVSIELPKDLGHADALLLLAEDTRDVPLTRKLELPGHGFRWYRLKGERR